MGYGRHVLRRRLKNNYWEALSTYVILRSKVAIRTKLYDPVLELDSNARPSHARLKCTAQSCSQQWPARKPDGTRSKTRFEAVESSLRHVITSYVAVLQLFVLTLRLFLKMSRVLRV
jgi:hypothetical protein